MKKVVVILGPTASGKTELSIKLAKKFNGEIISADSRQVYKGMDLGTGKITKEEMEGIPHYLLDVANPKRNFSVAQYKKKANKALKKIFKKGKLPFIVGGTGFYIESIIDNPFIPKVKPDKRLRKKLEKENTEDLFKKLEELDFERAENIDKYNRRRLIRAIEIVLKTKKAVPKIKKEQPDFEVVLIGIKKDLDQLEELISQRLIKRLNQGMIDEVKKLHRKGVSFKKLEDFGLEYRYIAQYLQGKITEEEMKEKIVSESKKYAKKQMTWFKRDKRINWIESSELDKIEIY